MAKREIKINGLPETNNDNTLVEKLNKNVVKKANVEEENTNNNSEANNNTPIETNEDNLIDIPADVKKRLDAAKKAREERMIDTNKITKDVAKSILCDLEQMENYRREILATTHNTTPDNDTIKKKFEENNNRLDEIKPNPSYWAKEEDINSAIIKSKKLEDIKQAIKEGIDSGYYTGEDLKETLNFAPLHLEELKRRRNSLKPFVDTAKPNTNDVTVKTTIDTTNNKPVNYEYVNHPSHYNSSSVETIEKMRRIYGDEKTALWCEMTAFKYRDRIGNKPDNSLEQEMGKIKWYESKASELRQN